jgi:hypothetical protein
VQQQISFRNNIIFTLNKKLSLEKDMICTAADVLTEGYTMVCTNSSRCPYSKNTLYPHNVTFPYSRIEY